MKIEVWSDYACPWCWIGEKQLEVALKDFPHAKDVQVVFKAFELDPNASDIPLESIPEHLSKKYGMSEEETHDTISHINDTGKSLGISDMNYFKAKYTKTFDAHRLTKFAQTKGKDKEVISRLFRGYFCQEQMMNDPKFLLSVAEAEGLDKSETEAMIHDKTQFASEVREDEKIAAQMGISGVPYFYIDGKLKLSGAYPPAKIVKSLTKAWEMAEKKQ